MKILCETQVINRQTQSKKHSRATKATIALGYRNAKQDDDAKEVEIIHFSPQCKIGFRYKVKNNLKKIFNKFVQDGKVTISFIEPAEDLMIKCDPMELKIFLQTLKLGLEGKQSINLNRNSSNTTAIKTVPRTAMSVLCRAEYPIKGFPKSLKSLKVSGLQLLKISFDILSLRNLTKLDLGENCITKIPAELGKLDLVELKLNSNNLFECNSWSWMLGKNLQNCLSSLDISNNKLNYFPPQLLKLKSLVQLRAQHNNFQRLPFGLRRLSKLRYLILSSNKLKSLPAVFDDIPFELLDIWGNEFQRCQELTLDAMPVKQLISPPLWLLAARVVIKNKLPYSYGTLPSTLVDVLAEAPVCACGHLCYYESIIEGVAPTKFHNTANMVFSREHHIYSDIVLCGPKCLGSKQCGILYPIN